MKRLAELLTALAAAPHAEARAAWLDDYLAAAPDPDRGWGVGWLLGALPAPRIGAAKLKALAAGRVDPELLRLSAAAIGDAAETAALIWPGAGDAPPGEVIAKLHRPDLAFDGLDAEPRVALARLLAGRKAKGARFADIRDALARLGGAPDLVAAGLAAEAPSYPALFAWLRGEGPAPAPQIHPPEVARIAGDAPPPGRRAAYSIWPAPEGEPVALMGGRAISADGASRPAPKGAAGDWGFLGPNGFTPMPPSAAAMEGGWAEARQTGALLLRQGEDWSIWAAPMRRLICPVTFISLDREVDLTLGVAIGEEIAPLIKLTAPVAAATDLSAFARANTVDKFGPVRQVRAGLWAELSYEGWSPAPRRKIKIALNGAAIAGLIWEGPHKAPTLNDVTG